MPPILLLFFFFSVSQSQQNCSSTCGPHTVSYPFGFSSSCPIPLTCADPNILLNNSSSSSSPLRVRDISSNGTLMIDLPPLCNRPLVNTSLSLFSPNLALTRTNALLLRNCSIPSSDDCVVPTSLLTDRLGFTCGPASDNLTCLFAHHNNASDQFASPSDVADTRCTSLFGSVRFEQQDVNVTGFVFSVIELGWWVNGEECRCAPNAMCTKVKSPGGPGFRCRCKDGFDGSGFADDSADKRGCYKVVTSCDSSDCGRSNKVPILFGGIIAGGCLVAGITVIVYFIRHCCKKSDLRTKRLYSEASFNIPFYSYRDIERATDNFSEAHQLGTGAYGTVYVGQLDNGDLVAVKRIKRPDPETINQVMNEVRMISSLSHPNLLSLIGCCIEKGEQILVYEFMPQGTLSQHLQRQRGPGLPWTVRLGIAAETAKAVAYLHSSEPPIYHRDIKSSNILLDQQFRAKIADFGLSRAVTTEQSHISTVPQGTPGYVDPQYHQNYHLSDKSDVYSFGVVLVEIITGLKVVDFNRGQCEINLAAMAVDRITKGRLEEIMDPFLNVKKGSWSCESVHRVAELAFRCLAFHRDVRPSMMEVADELEQIRLSSWAPKDGEVVVSCRYGEGTDVLKSAEKNIEELVSPVSVVVQDAWASEKTTPSDSI